MTTTTRNQLAQLAAHLNALGAAVAMIQRHLQESQQVIVALMEQQGLAASGESLTTPEERGT